MFLALVEQEVGEHAGCGPGVLTTCGFSYNPETFMAGGVRCYNFSWRDMGVPSLKKVMDLVQVRGALTTRTGPRNRIHSWGHGPSPKAVMRAVLVCGPWFLPRQAFQRSLFLATPRI